MDISSLEIKFYDLIDKLPVDISLYHPIVVHFAVALPLIAFIFQWFSILTPSKTHQGSANLLFYLGIFFILLAFITGKAAAPDVKPTLTIAGQDLFDNHKEIGTYLTFGYLILMFIKLLTSFIKNEGIKYLLTIVTIVALIGLIYEIKTGYELVYDYGAGTQMTYDR